MNRATSPVLSTAASASSLASPVKSPTATDLGKAPPSVEVGAPKVPSPLPTKTLTPVSAGVTTSRMPSPLMSAATSCSPPPPGMAVARGAR